MQALDHHETGRTGERTGGPALRQALGGLVVVWLALAASALPALAQGKSAGNLRIAGDASGAAVSQEAGGPGEKVFHLPKGTTTFYIAFDCSGEPTDVQVRVMGAAGTVLMQETSACEREGTKTVLFDNKGLALQDNEYVVNIYVSKSLYLADSLQLTIGDAKVSAPVQPTTPGESADAASVMTGTNVNTDASDVTAGTSQVQGPSSQTLLLGGVALMALVGIVLWAGWSAMKKV